MREVVTTDHREGPPTLAYTEVGPVRRLVRGTAASRPMTWLCVRVQQRLDGLVHRLTRGRATVSSLMSGLPVVMLTTTGARTGQQRTLPVLGFADGDRLVVIASNYGRPHHPAWYHNLRAHPRAAVTVHGVDREVVAHELIGPERDRCFLKAAEIHPGFAVYEDRAANRTIPVLRLDPA
jgi:deazaflavin-dependent oxidoreductase (nitroreductase family)